ncbi:hypothetical protein Msi02_52060 [Microbispora siamensis]|uniref:Uncharacterized protein n=1 Tax=Microbispora siamensis TaxID=564413 RepID=A0ABQ4GSH8_9ACTN|nr:hypothetical protein Msi02_52060 [Microbispora siamensis]
MSTVLPAAETYDVTVPRLTEASAIRSAAEVSPPPAEITATLAMTIPASASPPARSGVLDLVTPPSPEEDGFSLSPAEVAGVGDGQALTDALWAREDGIREANPLPDESGSPSLNLMADILLTPRDRWLGRT